MRRAHGAGAFVNMVLSVLQVKSGETERHALAMGGEAFGLG
jgi:hypothetical protein